MPELPEVETVRRGLEGVMAGVRFARVEQRRADLRFPFPERFATRLEGRKVLRLDRRAKYLLADIEGGECLLMHLGMSGRFTIEPPRRVRRAASAERAPLGEFLRDTGLGAAHDHVVFRMSNGATVTYNDPRRFGFMDLFADAERETHKLLAGLGVEPLGNHLNAEYLAGRAHGRSADLKAFLLDQRIIAGLGNIYVCEALHRAGLSPRRRAGTLADRQGRPAERCALLIAEIRRVLEDAIQAGGSTLRDWRHADGALGYFQHAFRVYDRAGEACPRPGCRGTIRRFVQAGRASFACRLCQR
jgi:formamidopyrimidine-DNA glycosylase